MQRIGRVSMRDRRQPTADCELYDLANDPLELTNLSGNQDVASIERDLREQLESWMIREHDFLPLPTHALSHEK